MKTTFKFTIWLITFTLAYFINSIEVVSLSHAFFGLHVGIIGASVLVLLLTFAFGKEPALHKYGRFFIKLLRFGVAIGITSVLSWLVATFFLKVDFFTAYVLTTLGQCMYNIDYTADIKLPQFPKKKNDSTIAEKKQTPMYIPKTQPEEKCEEPEEIPDVVDEMDFSDESIEMDSEVDCDEDIEINDLAFDSSYEEEEKPAPKFDIDIPL